MSRSDKWNTSLEAINSFVAAHEKYPSTTSSNPAEKSLAQWWSRQKFMLKKHRANEKSNLNTEQVAAVEGLLLKHERFERDGIWDNQYNMLVHEFKLSGRIFDLKTANDEQKKAIRWWNQQKTFARKFLLDSENPVGGMTQERFDKILALLRLMGHDLNRMSESVTTE